MRERKLCCWQFSWFSSVVHWLLAHVATISHCIPNVVLQLFEARLFRQKVLLQLAESAVWARQWHEPCSFKSGHSPCCRIVNSCSSLCITLGVSLCSCSCSWSCHKAQNFFGLYEGLDMNTKKKNYPPNVPMSWLLIRLHLTLETVTCRRMQLTTISAFQYILVLRDYTSMGQLEFNPTKYIQMNAILVHRDIRTVLPTSNHHCRLLLKSLSHRGSFHARWWDSLSCQNIFKLGDPQRPY